MTRRRLKLAYIENNSRRKACYKKRKKGLIKKVGELSTLCDVEACAIIYSSFDEEPEIWPPSHSAMQDILQKFKSLSVIEQNRKTLNQESFTRQRIGKLQEQCKKLQKENRQKEIKIFVSQCLAGEARQNFSLADLDEMRWSIHCSLQNISQQIETAKTLNPQPAPGVPMMPCIQTTGGVVMPTIQTPTLQTTDGMMMPDVQTTGGGDGYVPEVAPEIPINYSQNSTRGMNYPQNTAWIMNTMIPNEQFAGSGDLDWDESFFSYIFGDDGAGPSFTSP